MKPCPICREWNSDGWPIRSSYERLAGQVLFFFQAEDGIRGFHVTGVQTCALPIWLGLICRAESREAEAAEWLESALVNANAGGDRRSEERRVGKSVDLGGRRI